MASKLEKISLYVETIRILLDEIDEEHKNSAAWVQELAYENR